MDDKFGFMGITFDFLRQHMLPQNDISRGIVNIISAVFILWTVSFLFSIARLLVIRAQIFRCRDVSLLTGALQQKHIKKELGSPAAGGDKERKEQDPRQKYVNDYCKAKLLPPGGVVSNHIGVIFKAGWDGSHLDAGQLTKYTTDRLMQINAFLKSILSVFIIIGLLGTLFGIAETISELEPALNSVNAQQANATASSALNSLFVKLGSSFIPSLWGVAFSIAGVLLFSFYGLFLCSRVKSAMDYTTLTVWIPQLYPTSTKKLQQTLKITEDQISKNYEAAEKAASFIKDMESGTEDLKKNIARAGRALSNMGDIAAQFNSFAERFYSSVQTLSSFQQDIQALYQQTGAATEMFESHVAGNINNLEEFRGIAAATFDNQSKQISQLVDTLKLYEERYVELRKEIDQKNIRILETAQNVYEEIGKRNEDLIEQMGKPLIEKLHNGFNALDDTIATNLNNVVNRFSSFDVPLKTASERIEGSYENLSKSFEELTYKLKDEFARLAESNLAQVRSVQDTNRQIAEVLNKIVTDPAFQVKLAARENAGKARNKFKLPGLFGKMGRKNRR